MANCIRCNKYMLFKTSSGYCGNCEAIEKEFNSKMQPGNEVSFGNYYYSNEDTKEPITWLALERKADKALLLSKYGLDVKRYHYDYIDTTWKDSTIRNWLNNEFFNAAFNSEEKSKIIVSEVSNNYSEGYHGWGPVPPMANRGVESTNGGSDTNDKIFLLSYREAYSYFKTDEERIATPTPFSKEKGAAEPAEAQFVRMFRAMAGAGEPSDDAAKMMQGTLWWTRSPGMNQGGVTVIDTKGKIMHSDNDFDNVTVRPAMWIKI